MKKFFYTLSILFCTTIPAFAQIDADDEEVVTTTSFANLRGHEIWAGHPSFPKLTLNTRKLVDGVGFVAISPTGMKPSGNWFRPELYSTLTVWIKEDGIVKQVRVRINSRVDWQSVFIYQQTDNGEWVVNPDGSKVFQYFYPVAVPVRKELVFDGSGSENYYDFRHWTTYYSAF